MRSSVITFVPCLGFPVLQLAAEDLPVARAFDAEADPAFLAADDDNPDIAVNQDRLASGSG
jgi:hypothetical protein